ncbi:MAG TPA: hypothetical protein VMV69_03365 [Pirellulales bacterium]|nr:hypothetical protein [Pirellulales bacterium]
MAGSFSTARFKGTNGANAAKIRLAPGEWSRSREGNMLSVRNSAPARAQLAQFAARRTVGRGLSHDWTRVDAGIFHDFHSN